MVSKEEIIRMAREAGIITNSPYLMPHDHVMHGIERFAALIAEKEREVCAKLCSDLAKDMTPLAEFAAKTCEKMILARKP